MEPQQKLRQPAGSTPSPLKIKHLLTLAVLAAMLVACTGNIAYFKPSRDVASTFESGVLLDNHRYYVGGPASKPNAMVAIHRDYTLEPGAWREISVTADSLAGLIGTIRFVPGAEEKYRRFPNGARIMAPGNVQVGIWYSVYDHSVVRMLDEHRISLTAPPSTLPNSVTAEGSRS